MEQNIIIEALKREEQQQREMAKLKEWGMLQRQRLVEIVEKDGGKVTDRLWDLLLFNINGLRINESGNLYYLSFYKESKKVTQLLKRHQKAIVKNFNYITRVY